MKLMTLFINVTFFLLTCFQVAQNHKFYDELIRDDAGASNADVKKFLRAMRRLNFIEGKLLEENRVSSPSAVPYLDDLFGTHDEGGQVVKVLEKPNAPDQRPYLFEGDMLLTSRQIDELVMTIEHQLFLRDIGKTDLLTRTRFKRTLSSNVLARWNDNKIPFKFHPERGPNRTVVLRGIEAWSSTTCLEFEEKTGTVLQPHIIFIKGSGCYSNVGRLSMTGQYISIGRGCENHLIVAHEIGHSLGFFHEQGRFDRDTYIKIRSKNIHIGFLSQFTKQDSDQMTTLNVSYDLGSVMHYDQYSFSYNGEPSISAVDPNYQMTMGQRHELTFNDVKKVNMAYCPFHCLIKLDCKNSGYTDPKNCTICRCPSGIAGNFCTKPLKTLTKCGRTYYKASNDVQTISQEGRGECNFMVQASEGARINLHWMKLQLFESQPCENSYIEVKYGSDMGTTGARFCKPSTNLHDITSERNLVVIIYKSTSLFTKFSLSFSSDEPPPQRNIFSQSMAYFSNFFKSLFRSELSEKYDAKGNDDDYFTDASSPNEQMTSDTVTQDCVTSSDLHTNKTVVQQGAARIVVNEDNLKLDQNNSTENVYPKAAGVVQQKLWHVDESAFPSVPDELIVLQRNVSSQKNGENILPNTTIYAADNLGTTNKTQEIYPTSMRNIESTTAEENTEFLEARVDNELTSSTQILRTNYTFTTDAPLSRSEENSFTGDYTTSTTVYTVEYKVINLSTVFSKISLFTNTTAMPVTMSTPSTNESSNITGFTVDGDLNFVRKQNSSELSNQIGNDFAKINDTIVRETSKLELAELLTSTAVAHDSSLKPQSIFLGSRQVWHTPEKKEFEIHYGVDHVRKTSTSTEQRYASDNSNYEEERGSGLNLPDDSLQHTETTVCRTVNNGIGNNSVEGLNSTEQDIVAALSEEPDLIPLDQNLKRVPIGITFDETKTLMIPSPSLSTTKSYRTSISQEEHNFTEMETTSSSPVALTVPHPSSDLKSKPSPNVYKEQRQHEGYNFQVLARTTFDLKPRPRPQHKTYDEKVINYNRLELSGFEKGPVTSNFPVWKTTQSVLIFDKSIDEDDLALPAQIDKSMERTSAEGSNAADTDNRKKWIGQINEYDVNRMEFEGSGQSFG